MIFYIADFQIDLSRSVVIKGKQETQVEPKVLKVLLLLAKQQNEVVTHQEIMEQVWQGSEVVPNALQRCITILRKVLEDDAKAPTIIATHPRIGYRLLAEVRWQSPSKLKPEKEPPLSKTVNLPKLNWKLATLATFALFTLIGLVFTDTKKTAESNNLAGRYTKIKQLTQTDAHETHAIYSNNGEYAIFNRYAGSCKSHLWAKNLSNGHEKQLTAEAGIYGKASFTQDGRELIFSAKSHCGKSTAIRSQKINLDSALCWNIATLDFSQALSKPQQLTLRHQCQAEELLNPKSLGNHQYAFLQKNDQRFQLMRYNDLNKQLASIYRSAKNYIYHFDYHQEHKQFAIFSRDQQFNNVLTILGEQGQLISRNKIQLLAEISQNQYFNANFASSGKYLLTYKNSTLYKIDLDGEMEAVDTPVSNLVSVAKHPSTSQLLAIKGKKDIDIAQITIGISQVAMTEQVKSHNQSSTDLNRQTLPYKSLDRTAAQERKALYQPNGSHIAFISDRNGQDQLWLSFQGQTSPLTANTAGNRIDSYSWSPNGNKLAWVAGDELAIATLTGETELFPTKLPLYSVLSWHTENQLLVLINDHAPRGLYHLDITENKLTPLYINSVESAWVIGSELLYSNTEGQVFLRTTNINKNNAEVLPKLLPELNGKAMLVKQGTIYSVDPNTFNLNQYNVEGEFLQQIIPLKTTAWKVTDLKGNQLLLSQFIAINNEIVTLK